MPMEVKWICEKRDFTYLQIFSYEVFGMNFRDFSNERRYHALLNRTSPTKFFSVECVKIMKKNFSRISHDCELTRDLCNYCSSLCLSVFPT